MNNDEHKEYLQSSCESGFTLYKEITLLDDRIEELKKLKRKLLHRFGTDNKVLYCGDRIELIWPNGITQVIDIVTDHAPMVKYDINEYDLVYGYRLPNKDGSVSKTGRILQLWQSQLEVNGYKQIIK